MSSGPDFFELLGVDRRFAVDVAELERNYRERSKEVHPDRHVGKDAAERVKALQATMRLNEAIAALKRPASRAEYLLSLYGVSIGDNERIEPALIMEILDAREELAEAKVLEDQDKLDELEEDMQDRRDATLERIAALYGELAEPPSPDQLEAVKRQVILLRYVDRYLEQFELEDDQAA